MILRLPSSVHEALVADVARAMALRTPAVAQAAAEIRAEENARLMAAIDAPPVPTTAFDLFAPDVPAEVRHYCPEHKFTPEENSGLAFCPFCEIEAMEKIDRGGATP